MPMPANQLADTPQQDPQNLALLGHDLRAVLAEVRAELRLLKTLELPAPLGDAIDRCRASGDALARLIDQSVLVCLGQARPDLMGAAPVVMAEFLADLEQRWTSKAAASGHRFGLIVAGQMPKSLVIERTALERILGNLIGNAINHTPPCAVTATIKISDDLLLIAVQDEGPGFAQSHLASLTQSFDIPPETRREGGGFGLQAVKALVNALGGRPHARNKAAGGAEVSVCLPLGPQNHLSTSATPTLPPAPDLTGLRLFLADDSTASRELTCLLARHSGAEITDFQSGAQAQSALLAGPVPDLLILDAEMPGLSGLEVLAWLRQQPAPLATLPVMVLTSHTSAAAIANLRAAGADQVLSKPVLCPVELGRAVKTCLGQPITNTFAPPPRQDLTPLLRLAKIAGPAAAAELFARLQEDLATAQDGLARAVTLRDLQGLRAHSHVLVALAGTVGADALHRDAIRLNGLATDHTLGDDTVFNRATALDAALSDLIRDVQRAALSLPEAPPPPHTSVPHDR